jgi:hypothetical protein
MNTEHTKKNENKTKVECCAMFSGDTMQHSNFIKIYKCNSTRVKDKRGLKTAK